MTHPCLAALNIVKVCSFQYSYSVPVDVTQTRTELRSCLDILIRVWGDSTVPYLIESSPFTASVALKIGPFWPVLAALACVDTQ